MSATSSLKSVLSCLHTRPKLLVDLLKPNCDDRGPHAPTDEAVDIVGRRLPRWWAFCRIENCSFILTLLGSKEETCCSGAGSAWQQSLAPILRLPARSEALLPFCRCLEADALEDTSFVKSCPASVQGRETSSWSPSKSPSIFDSALDTWSSGPMDIGAWTTPWAKMQTALALALGTGRAECLATAAKAKSPRDETMTEPMEDAAEEGRALAAERRSASRR